jgi:hypothetical protein
MNKKEILKNLNEIHELILCEVFYIDDNYGYGNSTMLDTLESAIKLIKEIK